MLSFPVFVATYPRRASTPPHLCGPSALCVEIPLPRGPLTCCDHTVLILSGRSRPAWDHVGVAVHYCLKSFTCNIYGPPGKCCKQKTYGQAKPKLNLLDATLTENTEGGLPPLQRTTRRSYLAAALKPFPFILLRTLWHRAKSQPLYFQALPNSLPKNTRGGGTSSCSIEAPSQLWAGRSHPSHCGAKPLVQQFAKARDFFTIRGNNSAPPGV
jgi:hypothetical protein